MRYHSQNRRRLEALRRSGSANAIDYLEVSDRTAASHDLQQRTLVIQLLEPLKAGVVPSWRDVTITGGDRFPAVAVEWVARGDALPAGEDPSPIAEFDDPSTLLVVRTRRDDPSRGRGDHSVYLLTIEHPDAWDVDPMLASTAFTFKVECTSPFDCACDCFCDEQATAPAEGTPVIDYLAKDFPSLRRVMLDRMRVLMPGWTERHAPDLLIALTELVAYRADQLSYRQDAIATEALFATARDRVSLRRHALLLDYRVDEGVAARTFVRFTVNADIELPAGIPVLTARDPARVVLTMDDLDERSRVLADSATVVFETTEAASLTPDLEKLEFWGYGELEPVLPAGATSATLRGAHPALRAGDALVLAETVNPSWGEFDDASPSPDPANAQVVRLTSVRAALDPLGAVLTGEVGPFPVTEITWADEDALRRPLCLTADHGGVAAAQAFGNVVLADHGQTMPWRALPPVPDAVLRRPADCDDEGDELPARFRPRLPAQGVVFAERPDERVLVEASDDATFRSQLRNRLVEDVRAWLLVRGVDLVGSLSIVGREGAWSVGDANREVLIDLRGGRLVLRELPPPIAVLLAPDSSRALPAVRVSRDDVPWAVRRDLLGSGPDDRHFVAETDSDGSVVLRFGDDITGRAAEGAADWQVSWRDPRRGLGNVGRDTLCLIDGTFLFALADETVRSQARAALKRVTQVTNPLAASGGRAGVSDETIRREAPNAIWDQRRAVTPDDYAARASTAGGVQRTVATTRWTGSWYTTTLAVDPLGGGAVGDALAERVRAHVEPWRMAGGDLEIDDPIPVALTITLDVEVDDDCLAPDVERALLRELGRGTGRAGGPAYFHPDRITFGQDVALSPIIATAAAVPGVKAVTAGEFRRSEGDTADRIADGVIALGPFEIARCDNDPDFPDRGSLTLRMRGGR